MKIVSRRKKLGIQIVVICLTCLILGLICCSLLGCTKGCRKGFKHVKSNFIGIKREITWYDYNREVIRTWEGRFNVEISGSGIAFEN